MSLEDWFTLTLIIIPAFAVTILLPVALLLILSLVPRMIGIAIGNIADAVRLINELRRERTRR